MVGFGKGKNGRGKLSDWVAKCQRRTGLHESGVGKGVSLQ